MAGGWSNNHSNNNRSGFGICRITANHAGVSFVDRELNYRSVTTVICGTILSEKEKLTYNYNVLKNRCRMNVPGT
jgi:hypothetical protein